MPPCSRGLRAVFGSFFSTERSGPKDGVRTSRGSAERLRGAAVSFQMTTASSNEGLAQNPVQRGRSAEGACNGTPEHDARTAEHDGSTNPHPMKEDVAPGTADRSGTTEPQVLCLGDTCKCPLAGDPGRRRPGPESSGVRRIRRTDLSTDRGALSHPPRMRPRARGFVQVRETKQPDMKDAGPPST